MFDLDRLREIWITITHNKSRSFLTAFGVFWGMFMLIVMVGAGNGLSDKFSSQFDGFASNSVFFQAQHTTLPYKGFQKGRAWDMLNSDLPIIKERVKELEHLSPNLFNGGSERNVVRGEKHGTYLLKGCYPVYDKIEKSYLDYGRYINDIDIEENRKVCVIGKRIYEVLFNKGENPIGKQIRANGIYYTVVGVASKTSEVSIGGSIEETVILPFTTMQKAYNHGNVIHFLAASVKPGFKVEVIQNKITTILKELHQIAPEDNNAIFSMNIEETFNMFNYLMIGVKLLIWIVGLGTLFAGAIGVSNIMLVTVRERTKEIGIRRALGATPRNIIGQILSESIILTLIAGVGGIIIGVAILGATGIMLSGNNQAIQEPQISFYIAIVALLILVAIGTLAGFIPAQRAMMIKPIEAISEE